MTDRSHFFNADFAWIAAAYVVALAAAALSVFALPDLSPLWQALWADVAATVVIFLFGWYHRNSSFYDAYWSVAPPVLWLFWGLTYEAFSPGYGLLGAIVLFWAVRLTHNWARGWSGLAHVDWRYIDLKATTRGWFPLVDFFGIQLFPTLLVFAGCLPLWLVASAAEIPLAALDLTWIVVGFGAVFLELRADNVLRRFRQRPTGQVLDVDVWSISRHPNYLGELGFWLALALAGNVATGNPYSWLGIALMLGLFVFISIPMIEKRQLANKPAYAEYRSQVPVLLPWRFWRWRGWESREKNHA